MASTAPVTAHGDASPLNEHGAESIGSFNEHKQGTHRKRTHRTRYRLSESRSMPGKHDTAVKRPMISSRGSSLSIQWRERQSQSYISTHTHTHTHTHTQTLNSTFVRNIASLASRHGQLLLYSAGTLFQASTHRLNGKSIVPGPVYLPAHLQHEINMFVSGWYDVEHG